MSTRILTQPTSGSSPPATASGRGLYWLAAIIAVLGVIGGTAFGLTSYRDAQRHLDTFDRVSIPGTLTVDISTPTDRVVYVEHADNVTFDDFTITITDPLGHPVAVDPYEGELVYETLDLTKGRAVATFHADETGPYLIQVSGPKTGELTVGDSFAREVLPAVLTSIGIVLASLICALTLGLITVARGTRRHPAEERWSG
jgi:hypothetical protein